MSTTKQPILNLDKVLVEEIGEFGKFQISIIFKLIFACVFVAWNINEFVFTTARIETRCLIQECENSSQTEFSPTWLTHAVPSSAGAVDNCQRFGNASATILPNETCPASLFDTNVLQPCEKYVYENTNTVVYDFGLACDEWRRAIIGSLRIFGKMVALPITGYISDRWGRRQALALNTTLAAVLGVMRYWAPNYIIYVVLLFLESVSGTGSFTCAYVMMMELMGPNYRKVGAAIIHSTYAFGKIMLGLMAWATTDWKTLTLAIYIPQFVCFLYFWMRIESVRWLMIKGRFEEAEVLLQDAARANGKTLSQKSLEDLRQNAEERDKNDAKEETPLVIMVLRDRRLLLRCFITCIWWITSTFVYYGLSFNAVNLTGNKYVNFALVSAVEIPSYWIVVPIIDKIGRKTTLITTFWLCAACQAGFILISNDRPALSLTIYMLGKFAIAGVALSMNILTLELYPTECRQRLYNFSSMMGRLGAVIAPLTPALATSFFAELPFIMFGVMALLTGFLTFLIPETVGSKLADTMDEALGIERKDTNVSH